MVINQINEKDHLQVIDMQTLPPLMLLYGPPGTGKSTLAEIIAGETNSYYTKINGASYLSKYYGEGVKAIKNTFKEARNISANKHKDCIIIIEEIDSILPKITDEMQRDDLRNALNTELDKNNDGVICIGTTNKFENIDDTTVSRCHEYCVEINLPNDTQREAIIRYYLRKLKTNENIPNQIVNNIKNQTKNLSGRVIAQIIRHIAVVALRTKSTITQEHISTAINEITAKQSILHTARNKPTLQEQNRKQVLHQERQSNYWWGVGTGVTVAVFTALINHFSQSKANNTSDNKNNNK